MPTYRRAVAPGGTFFFTVVTADRQSILTTSTALRCLRHAVRTVRRSHPFIINAIVLLPDHLHTIWTLPTGDNDFAERWRRIKAIFSRQFIRAGGAESDISSSRSQHGERGVWQRRYWEHVIPDETDFQRHCDYIHYNPVKHEHVRRPMDWRWSSFRPFVKQGVYDSDWGAQEPRSIVDMDSE